ncbi:MAG: dihydroorotate dehydrogenase (quinone), partial [Methyloversatilis sp.]|nr:dihydroorotate dehydrogenase (quinone) [Methyloversatilis sp.]
MLYPLLRPLLFSLDAERAHDLTLGTLARAPSLIPALHLPARPVQCMGLTFPNPVGLAAGLDKNGAAIDGLARLGFGFIEIGTITPRPQPGNPKPRMFRLPAAQGIINRMGFNNLGLDVLIANVERSRYVRAGGILGINIGKNADTPIERAVDDYLIGLRGAHAHASYITVNISSPNTKNLRQLQG